VERKEKEFFAATLYTCYEYVKPDLALEYAWRFNMYEFVMPFIIQMVSEQRSRETEVLSLSIQNKKESTKDKEKVTTTTLDFVSHDLEMMMPGSQLMLTGGAPYQSVGGMGQPGMGQPGMMAGYPPAGSPYRPPY
jgi:clathrin heavy chain